MMAAANSLRRKLRLAILAVAFGVLLPAHPAAGTTLGRVAVVCPVCDHAFEALVVRSTNTAEGVCRDLFARAVGSQPVYYEIASCTRCLYSGYLGDFTEPNRVTPAQKARVLRRGELKPPTPIRDGLDQREIPATTRYALAAQTYEWRPASHEARAWLHLRWAWVVRDEGSFLPPTYAFMLAMREIEPRLPPSKPGGNQADRELRAINLLAGDLMQGRFSPQQTPDVWLVLAMLLRRHGENRQALAVLDELAASADFPEPLPAAIEKMRQSIDEETRLLNVARRHFEAALAADEIKPPNVGPARYLLGELYRRTGDEAAAREQYDRALTTPGLDESLRGWAAEQRAALDRPEWATPDKRTAPAASRK